MRIVPSVRYREEGKRAGSHNLSNGSNPIPLLDLARDPLPHPAASPNTRPIVDIGPLLTFLHQHEFACPSGAQFNCATGFAAEFPTEFSTVLLSKSCIKKFNN